MKYLRLMIVFMLVSVGINSQDLESHEELFFQTQGVKYHGEQVLQLQRFLLYHGFYLGEDGVDGWFGRDTEAALMAYQESLDQPATGRIKIEHIPESLDWQPQIILLDEKSGKESHYAPLEISTDGIVRYSSYYGSFEQLTVNEFEDNFMDFYTSPSGRFILCRYYSPFSDGGIPLFCFDILTDQYHVYYSFDLLESLNLSFDQHIENMGLEYEDQLYMYFHFADFYWTTEESIAFEVETPDGQSYFGEIIP